MQTHHETYLDERIPLQLRRYWLFREICNKAYRQPNELVHLNKWTQLAFGAMYLQDFGKYIVFGGIFEYAKDANEVIEQGIRVYPSEEPIERALTVNLVQFTKPARQPLTMLWRWNNYIKNRTAAYVDWNDECFFRINDEIDDEFPPHRYHSRLVASARLPLWENIDEGFTHNSGKPRPYKFNQKRSV